MLALRGEPVSGRDEALKRVLRELNEEEEDESQAYEWSDEEIEALLGSSKLIARQPEARQDYSDVLEAAVRFGLRLGEALGLDLPDVDTKRRVVHVRRQWTKYGELTPPEDEEGQAPDPAHGRRPGLPAPGARRPPPA